MTVRNPFTAAVPVVFAALTLAALGAVVIPNAAAQDKMGKMEKMDKMPPKMGKMSDGKKMKAPVYVSKTTKMYYAESDAKMMKMMDSKGGKLVKMEKAPMGYKMGHMASKTAPKMGKMAPKMGKM